MALKHLIYLLFCTIFHYFNITTLNFNVEVGGQMIFFEISDFEDPRRFFSKSPSQTPGARFQSLHTTSYTK
jgi:hypothetical protein